MKPDKITFEATIATAQFENIRPSFEYSGCTVEEARKDFEKHLDVMKKRYSVNGELKVREIKEESIRAMGL